MLTKAQIKRRKFAELVFSGVSATQAAKDCGYSEKTAYSAGSRLLKNVEVREYLTTLAAEHKNTSVMNYDEILAEVQKLINEPLTTARDKLAAIKLLGSAKTIGAWKEISEVTQKGQYESWLKEMEEEDDNRAAT
jgi:phage terminase small subunit